MKECSSCNVTKNFSDFYKMEKMKDGYLNKCKECVKSRVKKHRHENVESIQAYEKSRSSLSHRVEARAIYQKTEKGIQAVRRAKIAYAERNPMIKASHVIVGAAIKNGTLKKPSTCSCCGASKKVEGHHDDYTRPLDVRWLCSTCHKAWHREHDPIYK